MTEIWRPVLNYEDRYEISSLGRVRSIARVGFHPKNKYGKTHKFIVNQKLLSLSISKTTGYQMVSLHKNGKGTTKDVHRILAMAFIPGYFEGACVNHKNGIRSDNSLSNLEWVTYSQNTKHGYDVLGNKSKGGKEKSISVANRKLTEEKVLEIRRLRKQGLLLTDIASKFGIHPSYVATIANRRQWAWLK